MIIKLEAESTLLGFSEFRLVGNTKYISKDRIKHPFVFRWNIRRVIHKDMYVVL